MNLNTVENKEVNEGSEKSIIVSSSQNAEAVGAALDEIRTAWVDHLSTPQLISQITLREYAYSEDNNELDVVNAVFEYVTRAHDVYLNALYSWIEKASAKEQEGVSVPALHRIQKLLSQYNPLIKEKLKKYHEKAKVNIAERCELSSVSIIENQSRLSIGSAREVSHVGQEHKWLECAIYCLTQKKSKKYRTKAHN